MFEKMASHTFQKTALGSESQYNVKARKLTNYFLITSKILLLYVKNPNKVTDLMIKYKEESSFKL